MFKKILIANRGEIALRVLRACREMDIATVAVYSDADRAGLHVRKADEAYRLGPAPASESYLNIERILAVAKTSGADAVHPGYGFLSENPKFVQACNQAGVKFIGPPAPAMEIMGSKTRARQQMEKVGVPFVPGTSRGIADLAEGEESARRIGYPVMLKAAAGGGGKGMRLAASEQELASAFETARGEAMRAFGDDEVYLEKAIVDPRHIEMQVLADEHGNCVYLGERECSIQRRHQKILEESPSPACTDEMRRRMGGIAVKAAQAVGYANAGTIEFLADGAGNVYFLEMNTRLQVEHPVTEFVTGLDLVQLQIRIAAGEKLPFAQDEILLRGHAIECRINAEDPDNNYFPSGGEIAVLAEPAGPGIRLDSGIYRGWKVPMEYDSLLAKLVGFGENREQAIGRLRRALTEYVIAGVKTNLRVFQEILSDEEFIAGQTDTGYLDRLAARRKSQHSSHEDVAAIAAGIFATLAAGDNGATADVPLAPSNWRKAGRTEALS